MRAITLWLWRWQGRLPTEPKPSLMRICMSMHGCVFGGVCSMDGAAASLTSQASPTGRMLDHLMDIMSAASAADHLTRSSLGHGLWGCAHGQVRTYLKHLCGRQGGHAAASVWQCSKLSGKGDGIWALMRTTTMLHMGTLVSRGDRCMVQ